MNTDKYLTRAEIRIEIFEALREGGDHLSPASEDAVRRRVVANSHKILLYKYWREAIALALAEGEIETLSSCRIRLTMKGNEASTPRPRLTVAQLRVQILIALPPGEIKRSDLLMRVRQNNSGKTVNLSDFHRACDLEIEHGRIQKAGSKGDLLALRER